MARNKVKKENKQSSMPLLQHLQDLRKLAIVSLVAVAITSTAAFPLVDYILNIINRPLRHSGIKLVVTAVTEGIFIKFKIALIAGIILASPVIIWQIWRFVVPALYPQERRYVRRIVPLSILLFIGGVVFAYFTVFQVAVYALLRLASEFNPMLTVDKYLSFTLAFLLPFGIVFEYPLVIYFLTKIGLVKPAILTKFRRYAYVIIFVLAAVLTPGPDPLSQSIMAAPMLILYEAGLLVAKVVSRKREERLKAVAEE